MKLFSSKYYIEAIHKGRPHILALYRQKLAVASTFARSLSESRKIGMPIDGQR